MKMRKELKMNKARLMEIKKRYLANYRAFGTSLKPNLIDGLLNNVLKNNLSKTSTSKDSGETKKNIMELRIMTDSYSPDMEDWGGLK
jgi:Zn/Cd-binding protein ZinT